MDFPAVAKAVPGTGFHGAGNHKHHERGQTMRFDDLIVWHPYPAEKPTRNSTYLVSLRAREKGFSNYTRFDMMYSPKYDRWNFSDLLDPEEIPEDSFTSRVTAWAEMPQVKPYAG